MGRTRVALTHIALCAVVLAWARMAGAQSTLRELDERMSPDDIDHSDEPEESAHADLPGDDPDARRGRSGARQAIFGELFGPGILYSFNYELQPVRHLALRVGASYFEVFHQAVVLVPVSAGVVTGAGNSHLEVGVSATFNGVGDLVIPGAGMGYRYERPEGGFLFRALFTPLLDVEGPRVFPWFGLSFGSGF